MIQLLCNGHGQGDIGDIPESRHFVFGMFTQVPGEDNGLLELPIAVGEHVMEDSGWFNIIRI
jgi:hypothetical protein